MKKLILLLGVISLLLLSSSAFALTIDLTTADWQGADGKNSYTAYYDDLAVTATAKPIWGTLTYQSDGMGIDSVSILTSEDDEISTITFEMLTFTFSDEVLLSSFTVADLFTGEKGGFTYTPDGEQIIFYGTGQSDEGLLTYTFDEAIAVSSISFYGVCSVLNDFSVQSFDVSASAPVPEPATFTFLLLGTGLIGLGKTFRKKLIK